MPDLNLPVESGDDDDLPLGVILYQIRELHAQRNKQSEETRRLAHKLREEVKQKEAKAKQEGLQKKKFTEQVVAARGRREQGRTGKPAKDPWLEGMDSGPLLPAKTRKPVEASLTPGRSGGSRRQTLPANSAPPSLGMFLTAPATVPYSYGQMPYFDPLQMAMFEQGMRAWTYSEGGTGSLTHPFLPGSGGSTGSLTPPQFPSSRPLSFTSSLEELNTRLPHSRSHVSRPETDGLRSSREPSQSGQRPRLDGERSRSPHSSINLLRSSSTRPDLSSGSKTVGRAGHGYAPLASSRLAQPPASTEGVHYPSQPTIPRTKSMPFQQRRTDNSRMKGEGGIPPRPLASSSTPKEGKRTLRSRGSVWSVTDKLRSRTLVS